jgi:hypothetical protein
LFRYELFELQENGINDDNNVRWPIEFFFTSDWKFMYNVLGLSAPTAKYFCMFCECESNNRWNMELQWPINRNNKSRFYYMLYISKKKFLNLNF